MELETEEIIILEIVDIEEYVREGRAVPHARRYKYRVNKQHFETETPEMTRERILERAGMVPTDQFRLRMKRRHGPPEEIKPGQPVHLREHGDSRKVGEPQRVALVVIDVIDQRRTRGQRVAVELEPAAEWREFRRKRVAGLAGQPRLTGERWNSACRLGNQQEP